MSTCSSDWSEEEEERPIYSIPKPTELCDRCENGETCMMCWECYKCCRMALQAIRKMGDEYPVAKCKQHKKDVNKFYFDEYMECYYCRRLLRDLWPSEDIIRRALE